MGLGVRARHRVGARLGLRLGLGLGAVDGLHAAVGTHVPHPHASRGVSREQLVVGIVHEHLVRVRVKVRVRVRVGARVRARVRARARFRASSW